jgi:hypothetical protein
MATCARAGTNPSQELDKGRCLLRLPNRLLESNMLLRGFRFKRLLIVGAEAQIRDGKYCSNIKPQAVMATLGAFEARYDLPVVFKASPELAASQIELWAYWFSREIVATVNDLWRSLARPNTEL